MNARRSARLIRAQVRALGEKIDEVASLAGSVSGLVLAHRPALSPDTTIVKETATLLQHLMQNYSQATSTALRPGGPRRRRKRRPGKSTEAAPNRKRRHGKGRDANVGRDSDRLPGRSATRASIPPPVPSTSSRAKVVVPFSVLPKGGSRKSVRARLLEAGLLIHNGLRGVEPPISD